jgi:hypothetical protein
MKFSPEAFVKMHALGRLVSLGEMDALLKEKAYRNIGGLQRLSWEFRVLLFSRNSRVRSQRTRTLTISTTFWEEQFPHFRKDRQSRAWCRIVRDSSFNERGAGTAQCAEGTDDERRS